MRSFSVAVGVVVLVACGGKFTSVDGTKPIDSLSPTDSSQLCHDEYDYILGSFSADDVAKIACSNAYDQGGDCQTAFSSCVAQTKATVVWPPPQGPDCNAFAQALAQCNTTVDQYSSCIQQEVNVLKSVESDLPFCSQGAAESAFLQAEGQVSAQCLDLLQKCPLQFGGTSVSSGTDAGLPDGG